MADAKPDGRESSSITVDGNRNNVMVGKTNTVYNVRTHSSRKADVAETPSCVVEVIEKTPRDQDQNDADWIATIFNSVRDMEKTIDKHKIFKSVHEVYGNVSSALRAMGPNNVLCLDCSAAMSNEQFEEMKDIAHKFVNRLEKQAMDDEIEENVAVVGLSNGARVHQHLTNDFSEVRAVIDNLKHEGKSAYFEAIAVSLAAANYPGQETERLATFDGPSRLIFITNGRPSCEMSNGGPDDVVLNPISKMTLFRLIKRLRDSEDVRVPKNILWVPVEDADMDFLKMISFSGTLLGSKNIKPLKKECSEEDKKIL